MKKAKHDAARKAIRQEPPPIHRAPSNNHATNPRARRKRRDGERHLDLHSALRPERRG